MAEKVSAHVHIYPYKDGLQAVYILDSIPVPSGKPLSEVVLTVSDCEDRGIEADAPLYQSDGVIYPV